MKSKDTAFQLLHSEYLAFIPLGMRTTVLKFISRCDEAHQEEHILDVVTLAGQLSTELDNESRKALLLAAFMHDVGCSIERAKHEMHSANLATSWMLFYWDELGMTSKIFEEAVTCILQHRASYKGTRTLYISELMRVSDMGRPVTEAYMKRSLQFRGKTMPREENIAASIAHMRHKLGKNGTAWKTYPKLGNVLFESDIRKMKNIIEDDAKMQTIAEYLANQIYPE